MPMLFFMIAISVSIDSLLSGIAFGMKGIKISLFHTLSICGLFLLYCLMGYFFSLLLLTLPRHFPLILPLLKTLGNLSLFFIGMYLIYQDRKQKSASPASKTVFTDPALADLDASGSLDIRESIFLTLALSVDTVLAVFSLSLTGESGLAWALGFGGMQSLFMLMGLLFGKYFASKASDLTLHFLKTYPGYFILFAGFVRLFTS